MDARLPGAEGGKMRSDYSTGTGFIWGDESALELHRGGGGCTVSAPNAIELFALGWLIL